MLNKIDLRKRLIISLVFFVTTLILFSVSVFVFLGEIFSWAVFLNYVTLSFIVAAYAYLVMHFKWNIAFITFALGYVFSFFVLFYNYSKDYTKTLHTAGLITWIIIMILVVALGLSLEKNIRTQRKNKELMHLAKEQEKLNKEAKQKELLDKEVEIVDEVKDTLK
ncbi:MAG: hypothetical protein GX038_04015 [Erysipelothrix sp.]|nr:hypothetical protein [Erysipelothrix sp.]